MALTNRERIVKALDILREGLRPFVERELRARLGEDWEAQIARDLRLVQERDGGINWDTAALLKAMSDRWQEVFRMTLGHAERSYVGELREIRNAFAHEKPLSSEDADRAMDTMTRLLTSVSAGDQADEIRKLRVDLQRTIFSEQARNKTRYQMTLEGMPSTGLKPWRDVVTPHRDVSSGQYAQAEFAADLAQVHRGEGSDEYRDPAEFYRRTYITVGLRDLLTGALTRLSGGGGDPVIELQTNFGGGKTHSMLALYHLFGGAPASTLLGADELLEDVKVNAPPHAHRAVLVGTDLSPAQPHKKPDGTVVRTLWGELAWQLGGKAGFALVEDSDARGVSPGANVFATLFDAYSPALILIDEWVAYARQLVGKTDLPGGTFESQTSFAQALTEAAKRSKRTLVVASIPSSKIEIGGDSGQLALETLQNIFERVSKPWRPAGADEGFEIVRRRLFEPIADRDGFARRDAVVEAFMKLYRTSKAEFPDEASEESYRKKLLAAYPVHPELFRRLYDDWSTLDKFQRTRGVLRLLAKVIHWLWESDERSLLIMPASIPMADSQVKSELTRYLEDQWESIISNDVDGENSLPLQLDRSTDRFGRVSAARRVARTLYLGTAPGSDAKNPGVDDRTVRLGCVQPGETISDFGDALRRLSDQAKFIHQDGNRYWISTKANLNRIAEDRAAAKLRECEDVYAEIVRRLRDEQKQKADFTAVHACPESTSDVPDEPTCRLVVLGPKYPHRRAQADSAAFAYAREIIASKGSGPRVERNCLVFVAADSKELEPLLDATARHLAWKSIADDYEGLNLDPFRKKQADAKVKEFDKTVTLRIAGTWVHAIAPAQATATDEVRWDEYKITGNDSLAARASTKLENEEVFFPKMGGVRLRMNLDKHLWNDMDHVSVGQLAEWFARYLYLSRVRDQKVIERAVEHGIGQLTIADTFAVADAYNEGKKRYVGLKAGGGGVIPVISRSTLVVKPDVAIRQRSEDLASATTTEPVSGDEIHQGEVVAPATTEKTSAPNVFVGAVRLDPTRVGRDAGKVAEEVIQHLTTLPEAEMEVILEIRAKVPGEIPDKTIRTVSENARTLKFTTSNFERD
ncbi:MAG: Swt1 family HEPN domain-containing protein [Acidobacteriota bacterium]